MNKAKVLKGFSNFALVLSAICTVILMTSSVGTLLAIIIMFGMALVIDGSKVICIVEGLTNKAIPYPIRVVMVSFGSILIIISIIASTGFTQNQVNMLRNEKKQESKTYQEELFSREIQKDLYASKKSEITNLNTYDDRIAETKKLLNEAKSTWEQRQHQKTLNDLTLEKQNKLDAKNKELEKLASPLESKESISSLSLNSENGYIAMFELIAKKINNGENQELPITANEIEIYFFFILNIIFEILGVFTRYLSKILDTAPNPRGKIKPNIDTDTKTNDIKPKESIIKPKGKIISLEKPNRSLSLKGFSNSTPKSFKSEDVQKYLEYMYKTAKEIKGQLISEGYIKISKNIGLTQETCRKIKAWLEQEGTIKSDGARTIILDLNKTQVG